jgi:leucyl-tRNA synthetase
MVGEFGDKSEAGGSRGGDPTDAAGDGADLAAQRAIHRTIEGVTGDLEKFHFNRAVARIRQLTNTLGEMDSHDDDAGRAYRQGLEIVLRLLAPMTPHICAELWRHLGKQNSLLDMDWPLAEAEYLVEDSVTVPVQVNGKKRATIELPSDHDEANAESAALANESVQRAIAGKAVRKVIVVQGKIINVVV